MSARKRAVALLLVLAIAGCGGDGEEGAATGPSATAPAQPSPKTRTKAPERPPALAAGASERAVAGRRVAIAAGCLACHQIGGSGASKPGNNLDGIGGRRSQDELRQALVAPSSPRMPSYGVLPDAKLAALVAYLAALREGCDGSDCG